MAADDQDSLRERLLDWLARTDPARREIVLASLFLLLLFLVGTVGYVLIEEWYWVDGLYMTFITLTTIGFSEVGTLSNAGRFFTIFIGISGIGLAAFIAGRTVQLLLARQNLRQRRLQKMLSRVQNHFIVCGYGRVGKRIVADLLSAGEPFVVVDFDEDEIEELEEDGLLYVKGDAVEEEVLFRAGIERAAGLILTLPDDAANVFVTLVGREANADLLIISRVNDYRNRSKLLRAGAKKVISPDEIGADRMAQVILRPHVDHFMEHVLRGGNANLQLDEVRVQPAAPLAGKTLAESNFRQQFDAIVVAIIDDATEETKFNPSPNDRIKPGDVLIVLGNDQMIARLRREGCTA